MLFVIPSLEILIVKRLFLTHAGWVSVSYYTDYVCGAEKIKLNLDLNPYNKRNMLVTGLEKWTVGRPAA